MQDVGWVAKEGPWPARTGTDSCSGAPRLAGRGQETPNDGAPEPTGNQVSEPLNRCAGIFAMLDLPAGQAQP
jgi:hypothetical protein